MSDLDLGSYLRVSFARQRDYVEVDQMRVDSNLAPVSFPLDIKLDSLPEWMHRRLAVLSIMPYAPPTETISGVGRRMSKHVYWVYYEGNEPWQ
jgi:hypothetical protein